eukprot:GILK01021388.1.p1 GENE.GILK01021388.1~~GILK01021388.1.p1  ORF type:complete len:102 (-),score=8.18 GILK01021388.1:15-320(-)
MYHHYTIKTTSGEWYSIFSATAFPHLQLDEEKRIGVFESRYYNSSSSCPVFSEKERTELFRFFKAAPYATDNWEFAFVNTSGTVVYELISVKLALSFIKLQ